LAAPNEGGRALFVVLNGSDVPVAVSFPEWPGVGRWCCVLDTSDDREHATPLAPGTNWSVQVRCMLAFAGEP
jgi:hypothetical protein